jgi:protein TonB
VEPVYPETLRSTGREGDVVLELQIGVSGEVTKVEVKKSLGPEFDRAAIEAARQWEYAPAIFKGEPALMYLIVTVHFQKASPSPLDTQSSP